MTAKPSALPAVGAILKTFNRQEIAGVLSGPLGAGATVYRYWKLEVKFGGYYDYSPNNGEHSGTQSSAPSPNLNFKYNNELWVKEATQSAWKAVPLPHSGPLGNNPPFVWSQYSPQTAYGWKPATSTWTVTDNSTKKITTASKTANSKTGTSTSGAAATPTKTTKKAPKGAIVTNPHLHKHSDPVWKYDQAGKSNLSRLGLITLPDDVQVVSGVNYTKRWGFRFLYNPSSWGYTQAYKEDVPMPEQIAGSDVQLMVPGTTSWSLEIYLNRIPDMKKQNQSASFYPAGTSVADLQQLWARGTEYDLDFLYRVLNGDPRQIVGWKKSANIGVFAPTRVRFVLGAAAYVTANVASIDVVHKMMTATMIPTFTSVTIGLTQWYQEYTK